MDAKGNLYLDPDEALVEEKALLPIPGEQISSVLNMNRAERKLWYRTEVSNLKTQINKLSNALAAQKAINLKLREAQEIDKNGEDHNHN